MNLTNGGSPSSRRADWTTSPHQQPETCMRRSRFLLCLSSSWPALSHLHILNARLVAEISASSLCSSWKTTHLPKFPPTPQTSPRSPGRESFTPRVPPTAAQPVAKPPIEAPRTKSTEAHQIDWTAPTAGIRSSQNITCRQAASLISTKPNLLRLALAAGLPAISIILLA